MSAEAMDSASNIMIDDFFEGWLSIPSMRNLFEEDFWEASKHQSDNSKRGCPYRYPTIFRHTQHDRIVSEVVSNPRQLVRLADTPTTYNANDLRLFHHFLVAAHPYSSHEHNAVWVRDIPALSHQYDYLMHSILALASSHLSVLVNDPRGNIALSHR
ncbi:hypothetical protein BKA66DRAFT_567098 [Pyrenochaeta sp. MPI-SDFR-AT-0127]|nr:hypothetical protein BKA66DRAFT_567098 [Pyrenochaeta sp. MPI-SDFR-AT-0127]